MRSYYMKYKWNEFGKLRNYSEIAEYLDGREYSHTKYFHYTKLDSIENILKNNSFWLSCIDGFNDLIDKKQFGDESQQKEYYSLCFSTGINENLSLWYLYGGINGKGGRIQMTKAVIKNLVKDGKYYLYEYDEKNKKLVGSSAIELTAGDNAEFLFKDVIYYSELGGKTSLKYNTMTNYKFEDLTFLKEKYNKFLKGLIWYYEKETRLVIHLKGNALEIIKDNTDKKYIVLLTFDDSLKKKINIDFGPETDDFNILLNNSNYPCIKQKFLDSSKVKLSNYHGQIEMNICGKCDFKNNSN